MLKQYMKSNFFIIILYYYIFILIGLYSVHSSEKNEKDIIQSNNKELYKLMKIPHGPANNISVIETSQESDCPCLRRSRFKRSLLKTFSSITENNKSEISFFDNKGKEFWLCFQQNYDIYYYPLSFKIFLTSDINTNATVSIPDLSWESTYPVAADEITTVEIPDPLNVVVDSSETIENKGIHIIAEEEITVYALNRMKYTTDAFLVLPTDILNVFYLVMSYTSLSNTINQSQFAIVSPYDNVHVSITPSSNTEGGHLVGLTFSVVLNKGDVYQVQANEYDDLTGTLIQSSLPIAVFAGNSCVNVPIMYGYCDHIVEQLPPINTWGSNYVTYPLEGRLHGDTWRIMSSRDSTELYMNGSRVATLHFADFYETILEEPSIIQTNHPILVMQFSNGDAWDSEIADNGDPFMMMVPPIEQFMDQYTFATPDTGFSLNFVTVTVRTDGISSLLLDGQPIGAQLFQSIGTIDTIGYSGAGIPIATGSHNIKNTSGIPFGIYSYGFDYCDSYGYPGGLSLEYIYEGSAPIIERTQETINLSTVSQPENIPLTISATITDTVAPFVESAALFYRKITDTNYSEVTMNEGVNNIWSAQIPGNDVKDPGVQYYLNASDGQLISTDPSVNPTDNPYSIAVGTNQLPLIEHTPIRFSLPNQDIEIGAVIIDTTLSLDSAELLYRKAGGNPVYSSVIMILQGGQYKAVIPASDVNIGEIEYYIKATDNYGVSGFHGTSNNPHIIQIQNKYITIITPQGGESWPVGSQQEISWMSSGIDTIKIEYTTDNGTTWATVLASVPANQGNYSWMIPNTPSTDCKVRLSDRADSLFYTESNLFSIIAVSVPIYPTEVKEMAVDDDLWLDIFVGDSLNEVSNLYGVSFVLHYDTILAEIPLPLDSSIVNGGFLGDDDSVYVFYPPSDSLKSDSIGLAVTRIFPNTGKTGWGSVVRVKFHIKTSIPDSTALCFSISSVQASDPFWNPIYLIPKDFCTLIINNQVVVWPGDTDNNGLVDQADMLPIGLSWSETGPGRIDTNLVHWHEQTCNCWPQGEKYTYADANGDSVVDEIDIEVIGLNWHYKQGQLYPNVLNRGLMAGKGGELEIFLIDESPEKFYEIGLYVNDVKEILGMGIKMNYPRDFVEIKSVANKDFLGENPLFLYHDNKSTGLLGIGISRRKSDGTISGSGCIATVRLKTDDKTVLSQIEVSRVLGMDIYGNELTFTTNPIMITSLPDDHTMKPTSFQMYPIFPNPFNLYAVIKYDLPKQTDVQIKVFDLLGTEVNILINQKQDRGKHEVKWCGRDQSGCLVSSGIYLFYLEAGKFQCVQKGLYLK